MPVYYHAFCEQHWLAVAADGYLTPQLLPAHFRASSFLMEQFDKVGLPQEGLCIWPEFDEELADDFLMWRFANRLARSVLIFEMELDPFETFSGFFKEKLKESLGEKIELTHNLDVQGTLARHRKPMDILIAPVALERVKVIGRIQVDRQIHSKDPLFTKIEWPVWD